MPLTVEIRNSLTGFGEGAEWGRNVIWAFVSPGSVLAFNNGYGNQRSIGETQQM